jgi:FkbM family methyltransferase
MAYFFTPNPWTNIKIQSPSYLLSNPMNDMFTKYGVPEENLISWFKQYTKPDKVFIDAGSHIGTYTVQLANSCKYVHAFECKKLTYYSLCGNIFMNNLENVTAHQYALGSYKHEAELKTISTDGGSSSLIQWPTHADDKVLYREKVNVVTIDDFEFEDVGLIKIDVEGCELDVLKGAKCTVDKWKPTIMYEVWNEDWYKDQKETLFDYTKNVLNYKITPIGNYPHMWLCEPIEASNNAE